MSSEATTLAWKLFLRLDVSRSLDTVSCMCCVKAGLYHCGEGLGGDEEEAGWVDHPCTCAPNQW